MKKITKFAALLLAVLMVLLSFAGCNKKNKEQTVEEYVYPTSYIELKGLENATLTGMTIIGGKAYVLANAPTGETVEEKYTDENGEQQSYQSDVYKNTLYEVDIASGEMKALDGYVDNTTNNRVENGEDDPSVQKYSSVMTLAETAEGKLAIVRSETETKFDVPASFNPDTDSIWQYNSNSTVVCYVDILAADGSAENTFTAIEKQYGSDDYFNIAKAACDGNGNWYFFTTDGITVCGSDGAKLFDIKTDDGISVNNMVKTADGGIAVVGWDNNGKTKIWTVDAAKKALSAGVEISGATYFNDVFPGNSSEYDFFATNQSGILGVNAKTGEAAKILDWLDSDMSPDYIDLSAAMENGDFVVYNRDWDSDKEELIHLVKTKNDPTKQKKIITLACNYMASDMRDMVAEFNKANNEYRIKVTDYSQYNTGDDYNAGTTKLNTEIIAGNVPDIILLNSQMPITQYAAKGLLEDLTPYMERDFGKDAFVEDFFKSLRDENGKLYEIYSAFGIRTAMGLTKVVGDGTSWTFEDMKNALASLPEGAQVYNQFYTRSSALYTFLYSNMEKFVNWETGECKFDTPEFTELLEMVKTFPADDSIDYGEIDYDTEESEQSRILSGKQLLLDISIYSLQDFRVNTFYTYGKDITFVGFPGTGSGFDSYGSGYALSAKSENKEEAWKFISQILTADYQNEQNKYGYFNGLPTNKEVFDKMMTEEATPDFDPDSVDSTYGMTVAGGGNSGDLEIPVFNEGLTNAEGVHEKPKTTYWISAGNKIDVYSMTDYEKEVFLDLLKNTTVFMRYDSSLSDIIKEETQPFFAGQKSAEEAAKMIQSRATIYVNEQR